MAAPCLLGIDIGTSSVKTLILDANNAQPIASAAQEYPLSQPQTGYAEQNPEDWWQATCATVQKALTTAAKAPDSIKGIGFSGQMHGTVCLDAQQQPVRPAIIWADQRSTPQVNALLARVKKVDLIEHAPGWPAPGFMAMTLLWLAEHEPQTLDKCASVLLPKDYVRLRMTGEWHTDSSDAAGTWLYDVKGEQWSTWLTEQCGANNNLLPEVAASTTITGTLLKSAAAQLGLPAGIPVVTGCADQPAQALGYGLIEPGKDLVTIGTGGQVFHPLTTSQIDPALQTYVFNHAVPERWYALGAILAGGLALRWLRDLLGLQQKPDAYAYLSALAASVPLGAAGLLFNPHLAGDRGPGGEEDSGSFHGLRLHHTRAHLARAVMEGVTFALKSCLETVQSDDTVATRQVIVSGGATQSSIWRQIQADIYGMPLLLATGDHHACIGAALLAGVGVGIYDTLHAACALLPEANKVVEPQPENVKHYAELYAKWQVITKKDPFEGLQY